jgi:cysteine desulfurase family protein (TIGR01976 family)
MHFDVHAVRAQFPSLHEYFNGKQAIYFDNPGGTQVPQPVIDAVVNYYSRSNANTHGNFESSRRSDLVLDEARQAAADFLNADPDEVYFGNNMTSLTMALMHSLKREFGPGDEIVCTLLDHDANVAPWWMLAQDTGATIRFADVDTETCTLDMAHLQSLINPRTKMVAVGYASNATGTINDVATIIKWAHEVHAYAFIDAVQYAPHGLIDVRALDCDFLGCSPYKFYGPHTGIMYGKREHLKRLVSYRVRPAGEELPGKWETGTKNHEGIAGIGAAINYLATLGVRYGSVGELASRREKLAASFAVTWVHEQQLIERMLLGLDAIHGVRVYGITDRSDWDKRVATISIRKEGRSPAQLAQTLDAENIFAWDGNFYALSISERLGVENSGGLLRLGMAHYNTLDEVDRCLRVLERA